MPDIIFIDSTVKLTDDQKLEVDNFMRFLIVIGRAQKDERIVQYGLVNSAIGGVTNYGNALTCQHDSNADNIIKKVLMVDDLVKQLATTQVGKDSLH